MSTYTASGADQIVLTTADSYEHNAAMSTSKIDLTQNFTLAFNLYLGTKDDTGADGIAFVLQNSGISAVGANGSGLGASGIANAVAIEFDTYYNSDSNDLVQDHTSFLIRITAVLFHILKQEVARYIRRQRHFLPILKMAIGMRLL